MLLTIAWIALGFVLAMIVFGSVVAIGLRRQNKELGSQLDKANNHAGLLIRKPGMGWVPADSSYRGY